MMETPPLILVSPGGRNAVADMISRQLGPGVSLLHDPDGAPLLAGSDLNISISHSRNYAAIMLHPSLRCGIDIEEPRMAQLERVRAKFLSPAEQMAGVNLLDAWTAKEAVFKAAGTPGLGMSMIDTLSCPGEALLPDGRRFALTVTRTPLYTLTSALPLC